MSGASASPAPSSVADHFQRLPSEALLVQFDNVDPTRSLDNPRHAFGDSYADHAVSAATGQQVILLLELYVALMKTNATISLQSVRASLERKDLKVSTVYDLLDKFYLDLPAVVGLPSQWLGVEALPYLDEKRTLHEQLQTQLKAFQSILEEDVAGQSDEAQQASAAEDDELQGVSSKKKTKSKRKKAPKE